MTPRHSWPSELYRTAQHAARVAAIGLLLATTANAQDRHIDVVVQTVRDNAIRGTLCTLSLTQGATLVTPTGDDTRISIEDMVRLTTDTSVASRESREFAMGLTSGDIVYGNIADATEETVEIETIDIGRVSLPLESIARIDSSLATQPSYQSSVDWLDRSDATDDDRVLLINGDVVRGFVTRVAAEGMLIETAFGETQLARRLIVAVRLASSGQPPPKPRGPVAKTESPYIVVQLRNSGRYTFERFDWNGATVDATLQGGQKVRIEAERIVRLDVVGGRWAWLSHHTPISYEHTPMLSLGWEFANDLNVRGGPLTVAGKPFEHGIGVHSRSNLTYDLKGLYHEFVTAFGIDDDSGPHADVSVAILVDGKPRLEEAHVRRGRFYGPVHIDVRNANRIELVVEFGDNGDLQDRFDWIESALIRSSD